MTYIVRNGNNMPLQAPLIPDPFVPYNCPGNRTLNVYCRTDRAVIDRFLQPTPFHSVGDTILVYISDFTNCAKLPFMDAGIVIPVAYEGRAGGYFLFEYEDEDAAIAAGRDLWGYPKKFGEVELIEEDGRIHGCVLRKGVRIMEISCDLQESATPVQLATTPHLNIHVQPGPDGKILSRRIIERDTSPDFQLTHSVSGHASATLSSLPSDPLAELGPMEVLGGTYIVGDFYATETNGWGRTIGEF
ncbi:hypothetical protein D3880_11760 [Pseudomonas cavernae]|uniref:Acetoacetate decarboxylase n=1 Tax=Pseudomonas cavernae TaxID=2320867 RepID=A0A385Z5Q3_9PSED|nr:acetoacetate decarboxylase family protein [Pseudomonas cavernae]AYC32998.1 hypothetical protein D3880_11760 [Pseudomonas cavernae]